MPTRILLVGHCGVDGPRLQSELVSCFDSADVQRVNSDADLKRACDQGADLLLINREPLGFSPRLGVDLIQELHSQYPDQKLMLVSDYADAQEEAQGAGAIPGIGKGDIGSSKFEETIRRALEA
jgi:hypothetical protein